MSASKSKGIVVTQKEGGYVEPHAYVRPEKAPVKSDVMAVFSDAIAKSSVSTFVPPPERDKFGFLVKPKKARGPGEAFIGRSDPPWLTKIYQNYKQYAVKLPDPNARRDRRSTGELEDSVDALRESNWRKQAAAKERGGSADAALGGGGGAGAGSDSYKYNAISKPEFDKMTRMPAFPYKSSNGRNLVGDLPPDMYVQHDTPHSVTRREKHIVANKDTPGANKVAKAVQAGDVADVRNLLLSGLCSVHSLSRFGEPLLSIAASHAHPLMVAFLLSQGADRGTLNAAGRTAYQVTEQLIEQHSKAYHPKMLAWKECRALLSDESIFSAAKTGNLARLEWLLRNQQSSVHDTNAYGLTALHIAALHNQREAIKFLCERGANPDAKNKVQQDCYDMTPVLALHRLMDTEKRKHDRAVITRQLAELQESKEFEAAREELRRKKEWTKGTTAAKEVFAKYSAYAATDSADVKAIRKLPKPDITALNKDRYAANFLGGQALTEGEVQARKDFYLQVWPSPQHAKFSHWFRATFS
jgi:ankyrin repeat protein